MPSSPLGITHGRQRRAWHDITALGQHTRSTTLGVACHHHPWKAHTVGRRQTWHESPPLDSTHVDRRLVWHDITSLGLHSRSNDVGRDMPSPPLGSTLGRTTFGVACHHRGWAAHTIERRRALHDITSLGMHAWLDDVGRGITSPPLNSTLGRQRRA